jgi:hypothetical protein
VDSSVVARHNRVQSRLAPRLVVLEDDISPRSTAQPGGVFVFADINGGALPSIVEHHPDFLALLEPALHAERV